MASNTFGNIFKITTWGESHGKAIGVIIDGCPAKIQITEDEIQKELEKRRPGKLLFTSPRKEKDHVEIISGVYKNKTTGAPISIIIKNQDIDPSSYDEIKDLYRPSHANFVYLQKYKIYDHRGGGRASARETAARVAAGVLAKKILKKHNIEVLAFVNSIGNIKANIKSLDIDSLKKKISKSAIYCPDKNAEEKMISLLKKIKEEKDSIGGLVQLISSPLPIGLGNPIYEKLSSNLAKAMLTIPACVGFEIGQGFNASKLKGSENNDLFDVKENKIITKTNNSGGILAGISTGMPLDLKVAFKPPPSVGKSQQTINIKKEKKILKMPKNARHDTCVAIRGCKVVEAMAALVIVDAILSKN